MSDFLERLKKRPLSYSQVSTWEYNKDEWYERYILGIPFEGNAATRFGNLIGDSIGTENSLVPTLKNPGIKEYPLRASIGKMHMIGFCDSYDPVNKILNENKTTTNKKKWNQKSVDEHTQLDMYALLLQLQDKTPPSEVTMYLNYIPVEIKGVKYKLPKEPTYTAFKTSRTALQVAKYALYLQKTLAEMEEYVNRYGK